MSRMSRLNYAYAVGRVRALENHLVARPFFLEAAEEKDLSSALKIIFDAGQFHQEKIDIEDSEQLDEFLEKEESALMGLISSILHEKEIERIVLGVDLPNKTRKAQPLPPRTRSTSANWDSAARCGRNGNRSSCSWD